MRCSGRETAISRSKRAKGHTLADIYDDRLFSFVDAYVKPHTDARIIRCFSLHGSSVSEGIAIFRQDSHYIHASQISTGLHVPQTGNVR